MIMTGENRKAGRETCLVATVSFTEMTCADLRSNRGLRGMRPAANCLNHGTFVCLFVCLFKPET